jgi:hypothetical protein
MRFGMAKAHNHPGDGHHADTGDVRAAYERGRREERARHHRSPLVSLLVGATALVGGATLVLSALHGSFAGGGASVDQGLSAAVHGAGPALRNVADDVKTKTRSLDQKGG